MPSVTSWTRLEPQPHDPAMPGFAGRVADPLWLLARQWQLGELTGEDVGSPVQVDLTVDVASLSRYHPGLPDGTAGDRLDRSLPLETIVEAEPPAPGNRRGDDRAAAVAGARLLRLLGSLAANMRAALVAEYGIDPPPADTDPATRRRAELLRRLLPDGRKLYAALRAAHEAGDATTAIPGLDRNDSAAVAAAAAAAAAWLDWYGTRALPAGEMPPAWRPERLEHEFSITFSVGAPGPTPADEGVLPVRQRALFADDYGGGILDWWSLDVHEWTSGMAGDLQPLEVRSTVLPTGLVFSGMPAPRFWEFESGDINLDAISAAPEDLGRLLFMEFALVYGNDFFSVPVEVEVGSVATVRSLTVRTTFGETVAVPAGEAADRAAGRAPFRLFQPTVEGGAAEAIGPLLVVVTGVVGGLEGVPVEEVLLARDEIANLAWAVERRVPGPNGRAADRAEGLNRAAPEAPIAGGSPHRPRLRYELATEVPANWLPLLPSDTATSGARRPVLRLGGPDPTGRLLPPGGELHAERLGRSGMTLDRRVKRARTADGRTLLWTARRRSTGRGESSSGLRFDQLVAE